MRAIKRTRGERGERRAGMLNGSAEMEAEKSDVHYFSPMMVVKKLNSVKQELSKIKNSTTAYW